MEHVCSSRKDDECLFIDPNMMDDHFHEILNSNDNEEHESPLFSGFPSPFFDDHITTTTATARNKLPLNSITTDNQPLLPNFDESKRVVIKKRSVGKKDRHSKIHTAQGLRDRRMRLSLHIARKFFDLQDLLGFDKASNTIEWLFSKSNQAIKEAIALQNLDDPQFAKSEEVCKEILGAMINKPREINSKKEIKNVKDLIKHSPNNSSTRDQARARARDRTRERLMIKQLEKSKELFGDDIYKLGLGNSAATPNNDNVQEELGFANYSCTPSEPPILQDSPSRSFESAPIDHVNSSFENYSGINNVGNSSLYLINHDINPPAGWLNSSNAGLLGMPAAGGDWEAADRFIAEYCSNYEIDEPITSAADHSPLTAAGDIYEQNHPASCSSFFM